MGISIKMLNKSFKKKKVLDKINLDVTYGRSIGLLGPNGAGKTTLLRCCTGLSRLDSGNIKIDDYEIGNDFIKYISNISIVFDKSHFYEHLTGYKNLQICYDMKGADKETINEVVEVVGLSNRINDKVNDYSFGMKKRLQVAASLIGNPKYIFLDEPFNGLDLSATKAFVELFKKIKARGVTLVISTHNINVLDELVDEIHILLNGSMVGIVDETSIHDQIITIEFNKPFNIHEKLLERYELIQQEISDTEVILRCDDKFSIYKSSFLDDLKDSIKSISTSKYIEYYYVCVLGGGNYEQIV